jgi:hypothetical protein
MCFLGENLRIIYTPHLKNLEGNEILKFYKVKNRRFLEQDAGEEAMNIVTLLNVALPSPY